MPHLFCRTCGRRIYTVSPLSSMAADERRCPRCGTAMQDDRRGPERRMTIRRENPANDPGPPPVSVDAPAAGDAPTAASAGNQKPKSATPEKPERRVADRRSGRRRGGGSTMPPAAGSDSAGWQD